MSAKNIFHILAILLGYGLIISGFFVLGTTLEDNIKLLDIFMSCLIFTQFVEFTLFPLVNLNEKAHKEVGMLGIHLLTVNVCSLLSICLMVAGIMNDLSFKIQLICQLAIIFIAMVGRLASSHAGETVEQCYQREENQVLGKKWLKSTMENLMEDAIQTKELDEMTRNKIQQINEDIRYITPSCTSEAKEIDQQFCQLAESLRVMIRDVTINQNRIAEEVEHLHRILIRRKNAR